jgi:hypothetical protein
MKRLLQLGFILGLGGTLAAAYFVPWFEYPRYRSATTVMQNGGRLEQFVVRLPADRIGTALAATSDPEAGSLEHFKLRDADGNVIGIAVRHTVPLVDSTATAWLLTIPSRGSIALAASAPRGVTIESLLAARGLVAGESSEPGLSIDPGMSAKSVAATGEFDGIAFELIETWLVSGLEADGEIRGTLSLSTLGRGAI